MGSFLSSRIVFLPVLTLTASLLGDPASADPVADFYHGKTLTISVGFGPGGGYDTYARTIARHMGAHLPGAPNIVVKNAPGAGGFALANSLYNVAAKDGTEIATFNRTIPLDPLIDGSKARFDPLKFVWIGSPSNEVSTCVAWHTAGFKTIDDVMKRELVIAGTAPAADVMIYPRLMNDVVGTKFKIVSGYPGGAEAELSMEQGETQGFCAWGWSSIAATHPDWLTEHKIDVLVQFGMRKHPDHPDIPLAIDLARNDQDRQMLEMIMSPQLFARPFAAPPGVPPDRAAALRAGFEATIQDPAFIADANEQKLEVDLVKGIEIETVLKRVYSAPKDVVERVKKILQ